jgi:hypothetical protein
MALKNERTKKKTAVSNESPYVNIRLPNGLSLGDATKQDLAAALDYYRTQIAQAQKEVRTITEFMNKKGGKSNKK